MQNKDGNIRMNLNNTRNSKLMTVVLFMIQTMFIKSDATFPVKFITVRVSNNVGLSVSASRVNAQGFNRLLIMQFTYFVSNIGIATSNLMLKMYAVASVVNYCDNC